MVYDSIIIGAGPAGLTSAIYLGRYERQTLLLSGDTGGQTAIAGTLENYPGFNQINGFELSNKILEQIKSLDKVEVKMGEQAEKIGKRENVFIVKTRKGEYEAKSLIIAAGKKHRKLGLDGEEKLIGKGISYCATCDGPLSRGRRVVVVGGGNSAIEAVQILSKVAERVTLIVKDEKLRGESVRIKNIEGDEKVEIKYQSEVVELVSTDGILSGIKLKDKKSDDIFSLECNAVFVEIGWEPNTESFSDLLELNDHREVVIDEDNQTNIEGIFAAGDITSVKTKQTIVACGEGAKAAVAVNNYLERKS